jgi:glyoxylase-like metal-dependent hydrolase (beta-lactamase superfamily II)
MTVEEVRLGPHTVQLRPENGGKYPQANPLLVRGTERAALIDSALHTSPADADLLLVSHSHEDHTVGAGEAAEVWVHSADAAAMRDQAVFLDAMGIPDEAAPAMVEEFRWSPVPDVRTFEDGHVFDLGGGVTVTAIHLPGHTPGHSGFLVQPDGVAFIGDVDLSSFGPLYSDRGSRIADYRATRPRTTRGRTGTARSTCRRWRTSAGCSTGGRRRSSTWSARVWARPRGWWGAVSSTAPAAVPRSPTASRSARAASTWRTSRTAASSRWTRTARTGSCERARAAGRSVRQ